MNEILLLTGAVVFCAGLMLIILAQLLYHKQSDQIDPKAEANARKRAVEFYCATSQGDRSAQQDYTRIPSGTPQEQLDRYGTLCVLCDGMGGMQGGEKASKLTADLVFEEYYAGARNASSEPVERRLRSNIVQADALVHKLKGAKGETLHSGTTLLVALIQDRTLITASVGDSRIYLLRSDGMQVLTRDHNYLLRLMQQVREGKLTQREAMSNPQREALISYVGMGGVEIIDLKRHAEPLCDGDVVILASDGLYKGMANEEVAAFAAPYLNNSAKLADALLAEVLRRHIPHQDNCTIAVMQYHTSQGRP